MSKYVECPGSYRRGYIGTFPGESDRCQECGATVKVRQDGTIGKHRPRPKTAAEGRRSSRWA